MSAEPPAKQDPAPIPKTGLEDVDVDVDVDLTEPTPSFLERYARPILLTASALLVLVIGLCVLWAMNQ